MENNIEANWEYYQKLEKELPTMKLSDIASVISKNWNNITHAKPYLDAMFNLEKITDNYILDSGYSVVAYFLSNATTWKGEIAKLVKKELNKRLKKYIN
jgi:hypothetical protein